MILQDFYKLLQSAIGKPVRLSHFLSVEEWEEMLSLAKKQALVGVLFEGVKRLPKEFWPSRTIVMKWMMAVESIKQRNHQTTEVCLRLTEALDKDGFNVCILKGQANHVYYNAFGSETSLGLLRICGDVDAWIWPKEMVSHPVKSVTEYCQKKSILLSLCYLHAEVKPINGVPVEIHFRSSFLNHPLRDHYYQKLFESAQFEKVNIDGRGEITKLRIDYDLIFQINHIYRHLLDEGVGMRQVLDFYLLLKVYQKERLKREDLMVESVLLKHLTACGMSRFVSALMFVLFVIFDMDKSELLCESSVYHGSFLLDEIMMAGNFGHYDSRMKILEVKKGKLSYQLQKALRRFKRNLRFLTSYPEEVVFEPIARIEHLLWRKYRLYRI